MTRIDELSDIYKTFLQSKEHYQNTCYEFAEHFRLGFIEYMQSPPDLVEFFPPDEEYNPRARVRHSGAPVLELKDDGFYHMGLYLYVSQIKTALRS